MTLFSMLGPPTLGNYHIEKWRRKWIYVIDPNYEGFECGAGARSLGGEGFAIALHMSTSCREAFFCPVPICWGLGFRV